MVFETSLSNFFETNPISYTQAGILALITESLLWALVFGLSAMSSKLVINHLTKKYNKPSANEEESQLLMNEEDYTTHTHDKTEEQYADYTTRDLIHSMKTGQTKWIQVLHFVYSFFFISSTFFVALIPSLASSIDMITVFESILINFTLLTLFVYIVIKSLCPGQLRETISQNQSTGLRESRPSLVYDTNYSYRSHPIQLISISVFGLLFAIGVPLITQKACLAYFAPQNTFPLGPFHVSTQFYRWLSLSEVCPYGTICHIYSTLPEDSSTSVILNVHSGLDVTSLNVTYGSYADFRQSQELTFSKLALSLEMNVEATGARYIHSIYLDALTPATDYYAQFLYNGKVLGDANFSTLPDKNMESSIVIAVGGDSSGNDLSNAFTKEIAKYNPDVIFIGGDIAYDNGNIYCYYCWDVFLNQFNDLNKRVGKLIPLVLALGNHDIGQDDHVYLPSDPYKTLFFLYFPQHSKPNSLVPQVPLPEERLSYSYHKVGKTVFISLDTGYLSGYHGKQLTWLQNVVNKNSEYFKLANYHLPILPACFFNPEEYGLDSRVNSWMSIFEDHSFLTVFENHSHLFKRTFPITFNGGVGVVYLGDGNWGVDPNGCYDQDPGRNITGVFEKMDKINHVWIVDVMPDRIKYRAINIKGEVFDTYSQYFGDYVSGNKSSGISEEY